MNECLCLFVYIYFITNVFGNNTAAMTVLKDNKKDKGNIAHEPFNVMTHKYSHNLVTNQGKTLKTLYNFRLYMT